MNDTPTTATPTEITFFIKDLDTPDYSVNAQFAAMAYLGMCRHVYMSPDWVICQFALEEALRNIRHQAGKKNADTIKDHIEQTFRQKGYHPTPV